MALAIFWLLFIFLTKATLKDSQLDPNSDGINHTSDTTAPPLIAGYTIHTQQPLKGIALLHSLELLGQAFQSLYSLSFIAIRIPPILVKFSGPMEKPNQNGTVKDIVVAYTH